MKQKAIGAALVLAVTSSVAVACGGSADSVGVGRDTYVGKVHDERRDAPLDHSDDHNDHRDDRR
jgi:hypothetical protein